MAAARTDGDTIYALASGRLPAAIAIVRLSGPRVDAVLHGMIGSLPPARRATLRAVRDAAGEMIDRAVVLRFPGPESATGEDVAELHLHGSRAVVAAAARTLDMLGCREAEPGEFTRRALLAGRMDLAEVEGLADLLEAETEAQRRDALYRTEGALVRLAREWHGIVLDLAAAVEHLIDHDEDDGDAAPLLRLIGRRRRELDIVLAAPTVERIRDGYRVALAGPPNAGKSSLFNRILGHDAAIVSSRPGTTRDVNERTVAIGGIAFVIVDTAGIRIANDAVEADGIVRAQDAIARADIVIDLADTAGIAGVRIAIAPQCDRYDAEVGRIAVSAVTGVGIDTLLATLVSTAQTIGGIDGTQPLDARHRARLSAVRSHLCAAEALNDLVLIAEHLRLAVAEIGALTGFSASEAVLSALFSRFCVGK